PAGADPALPVPQAADPDHRRVRGLGAAAVVLRARRPQRSPAVLGQDDLLPAAPGDADVPVDDRHLPPRLAEPALAPAGRAGVRWPGLPAARGAGPRPQGRGPGRGPGGRGADRHAGGCQLLVLPLHLLVAAADRARAAAAPVGAGAGGDPLVRPAAPE